MSNNLKTAFRAKQEKQDLKVYSTWQKLINQPGAMASAVEVAVMKKHKIASRSTIWAIRKRVENAAKNEENTHQKAS